MHFQTSLDFGAYVQIKHCFNFYSLKGKDVTWWNYGDIKGTRAIGAMTFPSF